MQHDIRRHTNTVYEVICDLADLEKKALIRWLFSTLDSLRDIQFTDNSFVLFLKNDVGSPTLKKVVSNSIKSNVRKLQDKKEVVKTISVCYESEFGYDLDQLSKSSGGNRDDLIDAHLQGVYQINMFGFVPGFAYLKGLPEELHFPRKSVPDKSIPAGSVAVAAGYCAIYPVDIPGGWHVIGRTPVAMINWELDEPFYLNMGDVVQFRRISLEEYQAYAN